jgi:hypothetical protein
VVIGILIALQVNNWNEQRIKDARFEFGLEALYSEIQSTLYLESGIVDKINFQLETIDTILHATDAPELHKIPAMLLILDESGVLGWDNEWKSEYLELDASRPDRNRFATALRGLVNISAGVESLIARYQLTDAMKTYLRTYNIPFETYAQDVGSNYRDFIEDSNETYYLPWQLDNIKRLLGDQSLLADLQTLRGIKVNIRDYAISVGEGADEFLQFIQSYNPDTDYSLKQLEIIGSGLPDGHWNRGIQMKRAESDDDSRWEIKQQLQNGEVKFRGDENWVLDWGRGQTGENRLVFKGGNIRVSEGYYLITVDLRNGTYEFNRQEE